MACTQESVYAWFDEFEAFCKKINITSADQVYNCDESGFPLQTASSMKVCVDRTVRRNFQIASSSKTSITTLQCIYANGSVVPPAVYFPGVNFNPDYGIGFAKNVYLGFTKNGWMETPQFYGWLTNHFCKRISPIRPVVLLIDGHNSHIDYHTSLFSAENQIHLFRFPPHTSHAVQPTDRGYFGSFKASFQKDVAKFTVEYPGASVTKRTFPTIFMKAFDATCRADIVKSSFRVTGIWPTNRFNVDHGLFNPSKIYTDADANLNFPESPAEPILNDVSQSVELAATQSMAGDFLQVTGEENIDIPESAIGTASINLGSKLGADIIVVDSVPSSSKASDAFEVLPTTDTTVPGGSKSAIAISPLRTSTPLLKQKHPVLEALQSIETIIWQRKHVFMSRLLEGYDVSGDGLYNAWKSLYEEWEITKKAIESESFKSATSFSDSVNPILSSVLIYPTVQRKPKPARKKLELPKTHDVRRGTTDPKTKRRGKKKCRVCEGSSAPKIIETSQWKQKIRRKKEESEKRRTTY